MAWNLLSVRSRRTRASGHHQSNADSDSMPHFAKSPRPDTRRRQACLLLCLLTAACTPVSFYEKAALSGQLMAFDNESGNTNLFQKTFYSREASIGGIGATAGGGCGCTN